MMIKKEIYLEMKKLIADYESEQLNKENITNNIEQPYIEDINIRKVKRYNPNFGDNKNCKCGHSYYRHFDTYKELFYFLIKKVYICYY